MLSCLPRVLPGLLWVTSRLRTRTPSKLFESSRDNIEKYFSESSPVCLPRGHEQLVFPEGELDHILPLIVGVTEDILQGTGRLSL